MNEKECCEECLKCPDYTKHDFCHNKSCACHTPQEKEPWEKESLARQLHDWYLEATSQEDAKYNYEAVVPYEDLPEGSKLIDRYIAEKVLSLLASERADWLRSEIEKLEGIVVDIPKRHRELIGVTKSTRRKHMNIVKGFNTALTSIITRYKEELKVLESK